MSEVDTTRRKGFRRRCKELDQTERHTLAVGAVAGFALGIAMASAFPTDYSAAAEQQEVIRGTHVAQGFLDKTYTAAFDRDSPIYIDGVRYDAKDHGQPAPTLEDAAEIVTFNAEFDRMMSDPLIGETLVRVRNAESAQSAAETIVDEYVQLGERRQRAEDTIVAIGDQRDNDARESTFMGVGGFALSVLAALGVIAARRKVNPNKLPRTEWKAERQKQKTFEKSWSGIVASYHSDDEPK